MKKRKTMTDDLEGHTPGAACRFVAKGRPGNNLRGRLIATLLYLAILADVAGFACSVLSGDPLPAATAVLVAALPLSVRVQAAPRDRGRA